jgi:hypothetical protein
MSKDIEKIQAMLEQGRSLSEELDGTYVLPRFDEALTAIAKIQAEFEDARIHVRMLENMVKELDEARMYAIRNHRKVINTVPLSMLEEAYQLGIRQGHWLEQNTDPNHPEKEIVPLIEEVAPTIAAKYGFKIKEDK